ncbi:MAG: HU family DNA-binding protein [Cruoricaptor ignavus]|nr:HU family DNA-binding protein [Cruoricaptor ignavus]
MKYKLVQKGKPGDKEAPKKFYASPIKTGNVTSKTIAKDIAGRSSLTSGDVSNVLQNLVEILPQKLIDGNSIQLGDFGSFRISFSSEGVDTADKFTTDKIRGIKVIFTPSIEFKKALGDIKFEIEK